MRVVAGHLGGRTFDAPKGHRTHPMSEKMRGALFGVLGDIKGLSVLDAFSGSGALVIESISRGASSAKGIELDKIAHKTAQKNINDLGIDKYAQIIKSSVKAWGTRHRLQQFDLIFADPPYDDIPYKDVESLPPLLSPDGILVLSWPPGVRLPILNDLQVVKTKDYSDSQLVFYRRK